MGFQSAITRVSHSNVVITLYLLGKKFQSAITRVSHSNSKTRTVEIPHSRFNPLLLASLIPTQVTFDHDLRAELVSIRYYSRLSFQRQKTEGNPCCSQRFNPLLLASLIPTMKFLADKTAIIKFQSAITRVSHSNWTELSAQQKRSGFNPLLLASLIPTRGRAGGGCVDKVSIRYYSRLSFQLARSSCWRDQGI